MSLIKFVTRKTGHHLEGQSHLRMLSGESLILLRWYAATTIAYTENYSIPLIIPIQLF